jgi:hypothetical protein
MDRDLIDANNRLEVPAGTEVVWSDPHFERVWFSPKTKIHVRRDARGFSAVRGAGRPASSQGQAQTPAPPAGSAASPATPGADAMMPMDMCRQMMTGGQMMGGPMMGGHSMMGPGMMGGQQAMDPKIMAEMMAMRGEMMKAMGDIMLKHARKLQGMQPSTK